MMRPALRSKCHLFSSRLFTPVVRTHSSSNGLCLMLNEYLSRKIGACGLCDSLFMHHRLDVHSPYWTLADAPWAFQERRDGAKILLDDLDWCEQEKKRKRHSVLCCSEQDRRDRHNRPVAHLL